MLVGGTAAFGAEENRAQFARPCSIQVVARSLLVGCVDKKPIPERAIKFAQRERERALSERGCPREHLVLGFDLPRCSCSTHLLRGPTSETR